MFGYAWLIPALPVAGTIINGVFGRFLPKKVVGAIACLVVAAAFALSVKALVDLLGVGPHARHVENVLYTWVSAGRFKAEAGILIDPLSVFMMLIVTGIGFLIHVYSTGYMGEDEGYSRFFTYLNLFVASMLILVMANNYLLLFVGWELVGICSYLLISFWYHKPSAVAAGKKAFITTRVGDVALTIGVVMIFFFFGSVRYGDVFSHEWWTVGTGTLTVITLLLLGGAIGKSAQLPLYVWLPDAMEGPTPVSALIHAATMVTAGVYLIARSSWLFVAAPDVLTAVAIVGAATAFFAATIALVHNDIKRVLAYSTISQIGYMFVGVGVGAFGAGLFHLMTHAFFKALLFLGAGSVMHALSGETDLRKMGGLRRKMPTTYWTFLVASLAIAGIAPLSGFFSKDEILAATFVDHPVLYAIGVVTALLTSFYVFRLFFRAFHGEPRDEHLFEHAHESPTSMTMPLVFLAIGSAVVGFLGIPEFMGKGMNLVGDFLATSVAYVGHGDAYVAHSEVSSGLGYGLMALALLVGLIGITSAWYMYVRKPGTASAIAGKVPALYSTLANKYWVDEAYNALFVRPGKALAVMLWRVIDVGIIDLAVNGAAVFVAGLSLAVRKFETGYLRNYALAIFAGAIALVGYILMTR